MGLTRSQLTIIERARATDTGQPAIVLSDEDCCYLVAVIATDLELVDRVDPGLPRVADYFAVRPLDRPKVTGRDFLVLFERLVEAEPDADTYFACLAKLHKSRLKYSRILQAQPVPTMDQVGPRGLLEFGSLTARALAALLLWRKWMFDLDNRSAQETGYLFEPIIANAIGGTPVSAKKSPIRRRSDSTKGRQVDCIARRKAYEIKIRVTIAASGQGRWKEELAFPGDCRSSGFTPVLVVLDPTPNPKLDELKAAFEAQQGELHVGEDAWLHLESEAGPAMSKFLEKYVRTPTQELLKEAPDSVADWPEFSLKMSSREVTLTIGGERLRVVRDTAPGGDADLFSGEGVVAEGE